MKRYRVGAGMLMAAVIALGLGACDGNHDEYGMSGGRSSADCSQHTTCGTCTPVVGCGWCFNGNGVGSCAADPDACKGSAFSWTWEPTGCRVSADASTVPGDAGTTTDAAREASTSSDAAIEASSDAARETSGDAASD